MAAAPPHSPRSSAARIHGSSAAKPLISSCADIPASHAGYSDITSDPRAEECNRAKRTKRTGTPKLGNQVANFAGMSIPTLQRKNSNDIVIKTRFGNCLTSTEANTRYENRTNSRYFGTNRENYVTKNLKFPAKNRKS